MDYRKLAEMAIEARKQAYAPYSHFYVGAALLTSGGRVFTGCNIENGAFTPSNCAERTAFFAAVHAGEREFSTISVAGAEKGAEMPFAPCPPCGVCLQVMLEFCDPKQFEVILVRDSEKIQVLSLAELIPYGFRL